VSGRAGGSPAVTAGDHPGLDGVSEPRAGARRGSRRERVERNVYRRVTGAGRPVFEVGYHASGGKPRRQTIERGIPAARAARDDVLGRKGRGSAYGQTQG
jgi:hypothetical protein